jgi:uncharacterized oxidoreductase
MHAASRTVLVTGGASGIGLALAERFQRAGSRVVVCGRRKEKLREAAERLPGLLTRACDVALPEEREALHHWVTSEGPCGPSGWKREAGSGYGLSPPSSR